MNDDLEKKEAPHFPFKLQIERAGSEEQGAIQKQEQAQRKIGEECCFQ
jgi:hypothetical protein